MHTSQHACQHRAVRELEVIGSNASRLPVHAIDFTDLVAWCSRSGL